MSSTSTAIPPGGRHTSHTDAPPPLSSLLEVSEALLRAADLQDGLRQALEALLRWPGAVGARLTLRNERSDRKELEQLKGRTGPCAVQASSRPMGSPADSLPQPIVSIELWAAEPADKTTSSCLAVAASMLAQAIHVRGLVTENARLRQSQRRVDTADETGSVRRRRAAPNRPRALVDAIRACERELLVDALKLAAGNRAKAARLVSTTERIFNYKVRKHGIDWRAFRVERRKRAEERAES